MTAYTPAIPKDTAGAADRAQPHKEPKPKHSPQLAPSAGARAGAPGAHSHSGRGGRGGRGR